MIQERLYCNRCDSEYTVEWDEELVTEYAVPDYCPFCGNFINLGDIDILEDEDYE